MKAIIMAGGFGTRLRPLTINTPKPMVPVGNLPIMEHVVSLLSKHNITDITSLLYFQADNIKDYFKDGSAFGVSMNYTIPDDDYGTAGAVRYAVGEPNEPVLIISGDLITDFDLSEALKWHKKKKSDATLLLTRVENPLAYGIVITDDSGKIDRFLEKPTWGEAFSDTINTGIYILEPSALKLIPEKTNFDFSQNLFPIMLKKKMGLYGKITKGYWKDIGNVDEYQNVHNDLFENKLSLNLKVVKSQIEDAEVYVGKNSQLGNNIKFSGKVILGNDVRIANDVILHNCVIGDRAQINSATEIRNSVLWVNNQIGAKSLFNSVLIGNNSYIDSDVQLMDKVIISDDCKIGKSATVKANCKVWPGKTIEDGAIVSTSMVWGEKWNRDLFTDAKITGLALTEITPEMAVNIGAAFGAYLPEKSEVITSRDASDTSRLLKRGLIAGLLAAGINVSDIETLPVPIVRYCLHNGNYSAGIYIRHNPDDYRLIDMIFFDGKGVDLPTASSKKIERMYFGEDFERANLDNIGHLENPTYPLENYRNDFLKNIDIDLIQTAGFKIVIDHSNGSSSQIFPTLFSQFGISAIELNGSLNPRKFSSSALENSQAIVQLSTIVKSLHADIGFILNPAAEKLTIVDNQGTPIDSQLLLLIVTDLFLQTHKCKKIAVPVGSSMGVDEIAAQYNVEVIRIASDHYAMMSTFMETKVDFVGGTKGGFIFQGFQTGSDAMFSVVKILEMMAQTKTNFSHLREKYDHYHRNSLSVPCPWAKKGTVMRQLIKSSEHKKRELIDGVKIFSENGWILITPDRLTASFNLSAESTDKKSTQALLDKYQKQVETFQTK